MKNALVVYMQSARPHLKRVKKAFERAGWRCCSTVRESLRPYMVKGMQLVVTVGGDGTFLRAARYIKDDTPILGINSNPKRKEGFFTTATIKNFERRFKRPWKVTKLGRLEAKLNNKPLGVLALNEFFISHLRPQQSSLYDISVGKKKEFHKSSGVIVSTPAGSHGWARSAGGKRMPLGSKRFQYVVRDPYAGKILQPKLVKGILAGDATIKIISRMDKGIVDYDSTSKEFPFRQGSVLEIKKSKKDLSMIRL